MQGTEFAFFCVGEFETGTLEEIAEDGGGVEECGDEGFAEGFFEEGGGKGGEGRVEEGGGRRKGKEALVGGYCGTGKEDAGFGAGEGNAGVFVVGGGVR